MQEPRAGTHGDGTACLITASDGLTPEEWRVARWAGANVLFVGPDGLAQRIVERMWRELSRPIEVWRPGSGLVLPPAGRVGTPILQGVGAMAPDDQRRLCCWSEVSFGRTRVVSPEPLLLRLESGTSCDTLYYRLNMLFFEMTEGD